MKREKTTENVQQIGIKTSLDKKSTQTDLMEIRGIVRNVFEPLMQN